MLILIKLEDGTERAINLSNVEFEAITLPDDASKVKFIVHRERENIEAVITEDRYREVLNALQEERRLIPLV